LKHTKDAKKYQGDETAVLIGIMNSLKTFLISVKPREIFMGSFSFHKSFGFNPYKGKEPFFLLLSNFTHKSLHYQNI